MQSGAVSLRPLRLSLYLVVTLSQVISGLADFELLKFPHTKHILQVGFELCLNLESSHYRNGRRKALSLLHLGRPRGLTLCDIPSGHHQSIEREDSTT
jgi:hypothetical protein